MAVTIQTRRDTAANWTLADPVLALGEIGIETDTDKAKYGDGFTLWSALPYWIDEGAQIPDGVNDGETLRWEASSDQWQANTALRITDDGDVGVGTGFPGNLAKFAVRGEPAICAQDNGGTRAEYLWAGSDGTILMSHRTAGADAILDLAAGGNIGFRTAGNERMRIGSVGNVGINATNLTYQLTVEHPSNGDPYMLLRHSNTTGATGILFGSSDSDVIGRVVYEHSDNSLRFWTDGAERVRIDSAGNLGVGTDAPLSTLHVNATAPVLRLSDSDAGAFATIEASNGNLLYQADKGNAVGSSAHAFYIDGIERARIDSSGNFLVAKTSTGLGSVGHELKVSGQAIFTRNAATPVAVNRLGSGGTMVQYYLSGVTSGVITTTSGGTPSFASGSDERLKENIVDMPDQLAGVLALRPVDYTLKASGAKASGFIAQEVQGVWPHKVLKDEDEYLMLADMGDTTARLVKAIQELSARVEALEAVVNQPVS